MIALEFNWLYIPFLILVITLIAIIAIVINQPRGDYDFGTPLIGCGLMFLLLLVIAIFGGILWW